MTGRRFLGLTAALCLFLVSSEASEQSGAKDPIQRHFEKVLRSLPPHSALPPLLDLSTAGASSENNAARAWEDRFTGSMGVRPIEDPGVNHPSDKTSITVTTSEYTTPVWALPARSCDVVVLAKPVNPQVHLSYNRRFVYSTFDLKVDEVLKSHRRQHRVDNGTRLVAAQLGGSLRFPSGHLETLIRADEGFMEPGKQYLLFLWSPTPGNDPYMTAGPYLVDDGKVFPIKTVADVSAYSGMPFDRFEAKVKSAIKKNIDTN